MVDLRDFKVKQIFDIPNIQSSHGGAFVTPNTEYVHVSSKTPALIDDSDIDGSLDDFANKFRGFSTFVAVNQQTGRFDLDKSFQVELPPYTQDLADSGKLVSNGWVFINSYNTEMATGGVLEGKDSIEVGASANDFDYLHAINWKKAEELFNAGARPCATACRLSASRTPSPKASSTSSPSRAARTASMSRPMGTTFPSAASWTRTSASSASKS
jgi:nitrous-oxide reductase